jgi:capsule polysaccharide export protein KpsE/RkpR
MAPSTIDMIAGLAGLAQGGGMLSGGSSSKAAGGLAKLLGGADMGEVFLGAMQSQTLEDRIIDRFGLMDYYHASNIEDARKALEDKVDLQSDRKSGIISIDVSDKDPERASEIAHAYVDELGKLMATVSTSSARRERVFLENRLTQLKAQLDVDSVNFSNFASKNTALDIPEQAKAEVGAAAELQGEIVLAQAELSGMRQIYTADNYRVKQTEAQIAQLQNELEKLGGKDAVLKPTLGSEELYPSIRELPQLGVGWADLYRQLKIDETVYELLTEQYELARIEEAKETPTVQVLDPGNVAQRKSFPPRSVLVLLMTLLCTSLALLWLVMRDRWASVDPGDGRKLLWRDVYETTAAHPVWRSGMAQKIYFGFRAGSEAAAHIKGRILRSRTSGENMPEQQ